MLDSGIQSLRDWIVRIEYTCGLAMVGGRMIE